MLPINVREMRDYVRWLRRAYITTANQSNRPDMCRHTVSRTLLEVMPVIESAGLMTSEGATIIRGEIAISAHVSRKSLPHASGLLLSTFYSAVRDFFVCV